MKYAADYLASNMEQNEWLESKDSENFVSSLIDTLKYIPFCSNNVVLVYGYCLATLNKWASKTSSDNKITLINSLEQRLHEFVSFIIEIGFCK